LLYIILFIEIRVINLCDRNIAINFGVVAGEVILVDSCAVIIICCVIVIYFVGKKNAACWWYCTGTIQNKVFGGIRPRPFVS
jgi:hypothetical protein